MKKYNAIWFSLALAALIMMGHFYFGWLDYVNEAETHGTTATLSDYRVHWLNMTLENWQSEVLQIAYQFAISGGLFVIFGRRIVAHELDVEQLKDDVADIKKSVAQLVNK